MVNSAIHVAVHVAAAAVCLPICKSGLADVAATIAQLLGQLVYDVLEDDRVYVLAHQVDEEPVADVGLPNDHLDALPLDPPIAEPEDEGPDVGREDDHDAVDEDEEAEQAQEEQPEPDEDVDLLVDNVQRQDAQGIVLLYVAGRSELVERALGHPREDVDHGIDAILLVSIGEAHHFNAIGEERAVEESV